MNKLPKFLMVIYILIILFFFSFVFFIKFDIETYEKNTAKKTLKNDIIKTDLKLKKKYLLFYKEW